MSWSGRSVVVAMVIIAGCADATPPRVTPQGAAMPEVTITSAGERPGRPPLVRLLVNVTVANPAAEPRWVMIQSKLPGGTGGVDKLEQLTAGTVKLGRFLGTAGFYGFALAPGARLTIRNLEIAWWSDGAKAPPPIEVRIARGVNLGADAIATWFDADPAVKGTVAIDADQAQHTRSKRAADDREVPVSLVGGESTRVTISR